MRPGYAAALSMAITLPVGGQTPSATSTREFRIDAGHSSIEFDIPFMYSRVRGRFDDVRGTILLPDSSTGDIGHAGAMAVIRVASINTGSAHRDEHLRSSDFFDDERFPLIVFRATGVTGSRREFTIVGSLTMHGVTREIRIPARVVLAPVHDAHNVVLAQIIGSTTIARKDFGIMGGDVHNEWFDRLRSATMGDSAHISLDVHLWMPDASNPVKNTLATILKVDSVGIDSAVTLLRALYARDSAKFASAQPSLDDVGMTLLERGRVRDGFLWLHAIARLLPASADAMVSVGTANALMGDSTRAMIWYGQAIAADSLNTRAYARIGARSRVAGRSPEEDTTWRVVSLRYRQLAVPLTVEKGERSQRKRSRHLSEDRAVSAVRNDPEMGSGDTGMKFHCERDRVQRIAVAVNEQRSRANRTETSLGEAHVLAVGRKLACHAPEAPDLLVTPEVPPPHHGPLTLAVRGGGGGTHERARLLGKMRRGTHEHHGFRALWLHGGDVQQRLRAHAHADGLRAFDAKMVEESEHVRRYLPEGERARRVGGSPVPAQIRNDQPIARRWIIEVEYEFPVHSSAATAVEQQ